MTVKVLEFSTFIRPFVIGTLLLGPRGISKMASKGDEIDVNMEVDAPQKEQSTQRLFTLKKWNAVAMWSWDVECDTCAICRVLVMCKLIIISFCDVFNERNPSS